MWNDAPHFENEYDDHLQVSSFQDVMLECQRVSEGTPKYEQLCGVAQNLQVWGDKENCRFDIFVSRNLSFELEFRWIYNRPSEDRTGSPDGTSRRMLSAPWKDIYPINFNLVDYCTHIVNFNLALCQFHIQSLSMLAIKIHSFQEKLPGPEALIFGGFWCFCKLTLKPTHWTILSPHYHGFPPNKSAR